jgi:hypothetical protein
MYANLPVGRYIQQKIEESGIKKVEVVRRCGWQNVGGGLRRLDKVIRDSAPDMDLLNKLVVVLGLDKDELNQQMRLTNTLREMADAKAAREARTNWTPFLYVLAELSCPTAITFCALCGGDRSRYAEVPASVTLLPYEEQLAEVGRLLREHYAMRTGRTFFFGKIVNYLYQYTYDYGIELSVTGEVVGERTTPFEPPRVTLRIGSKIVPGGLFRLLT